MIPFWSPRRSGATVSLYSTETSSAIRAIAAPAKHARHFSTSLSLNGTPRTLR